MSRTLPQRQPVELPGPAGRLEGLLEVPEGWSGAAVGVVCHPHPLYHGTMMNKVVHTLCRTLHTCNVASLRFNFRGVGGSTGGFDEGNGETEDVMAARSWLAERFPTAECWLAGFSFGAAMSVRAAVRSVPARLITVAPAPAWLESVTDRPECPWVVVQGDADEIVPIGSVRAWIDTVKPPPELIVMPGVGHFFHGSLGALRDCLYQACRVG